MRYKKILNDPVYGFIRLPEGLLFTLIEHPYLQRLRYIKQVGLSHYVYPGALHTRFHHALGAMHLALQVCEILKSKGISISLEEQESLAAAMLLHDIGHGPFSHALEYELLPISHEEVSLQLIQRLNVEMNGRLDLCLEMFENKYSRSFFHQLICSQLDLDRMDYLARDSYFTGVIEGRVAYDRLLHMFHVCDDQLVVEEKGIYSVEKFLFARRLMYWQVYLHKTVLSAEQMLIKLIRRVKSKMGIISPEEAGAGLYPFLSGDLLKGDIYKDRLLTKYCSLDDTDVNYLIKQLLNHNDRVIQIIARSLYRRNLFKLHFFDEEISDLLSIRRQELRKRYNLNDEDLSYLVFTGEESNREYNINKKEILILRKNNSIEPISLLMDFKLKDKALVKKYICYAKIS